MIDLSRDEERARSTLEVPLSKLRGLLQMWTHFKSATLVTQEFLSSFDELSFQLRIACTKALVVDYYRPWSGNFNPDLKSLQCGTNKKWRYPFMDEVINKIEHSEIAELRNKLIAHIEFDYEAIALTVKGARVGNAPQQENTIPETFLPVQSKLTSVRGIWWISDKSTVERLLEHVKHASATVQKEMGVVSSRFRELCSDWMHVLPRLTDMFAIESMAGEDLNFLLKPHDESDVPLITGTPVPVKLGDQNINSLVVVFEPSPNFPDSIDKPGRGFRLTMDMDQNGSATFNVSFPRYPYPILSKHLPRIVYYANLLNSDPAGSSCPLRNLEGLLRNQVLLNEIETSDFVAEVINCEEIITETQVRQWIDTGLGL